jgi:hypothetical protein
MQSPVETKKPDGIADKHSHHSISHYSRATCAPDGVSCHRLAISNSGCQILENNRMQKQRSQMIREIHAWSQARRSEELDHGEIDSGSIIKGVKRESTVPERLRAGADSG